MTQQEFISRLNEWDEYSTDAQALIDDVLELAGADGNTSADEWPLIECPCCGRAIVLSCYAGFTSEEYDPSVYSVLVRGTDYCAECASEMVERLAGRD